MSSSYDRIAKYQTRGSLTNLYAIVERNNINISILDFCRVVPRYAKRLTGRQSDIFALYYLQQESIVDILRYRPAYQYRYKIDAILTAATNRFIKKLKKDFGVKQPKTDE